MRKIVYLVGAVVLLGWVLGCGNKSGGLGDTPTPTPSPVPTPSTGAIDVTWTTPGSQPTSVELRLLDGALSGNSCASLQLAPAPQGGVLQSNPGLPAAASLTYGPLNPGSSYLVLAVGVNTAGLPMVTGCHDQLSVFAGNTTTVDLTLGAFAPDLTGTYRVAQKLNIGLPQPIQDALNGLAAICQLTSAGNAACQAIEQTDTLLTALPIVAQWTITPTGTGSYTGTVKWVQVDGLDVSTIDLADGSFGASVSNGSHVVYQNFQTTIQVGNLVIFLIQNVGGIDLGVFGPTGASFIQQFLSQYLSPLQDLGDGYVEEHPDFTVSDIQGQLNETITVAGNSHGMIEAYDAVKQ